MNDLRLLYTFFHTHPIPSSEHLSPHLPQTPAPLTKSLFTSPHTLTHFSTLPSPPPSPNSPHLPPHPNTLSHIFLIFFYPPHPNTLPTPPHSSSHSPHSLKHSPIPSSTHLTPFHINKRSHRKAPVLLAGK